MSPDVSPERDEATPEDGAAALRFPIALRVALTVVLLEAVAFVVLAVAEVVSLSGDRLSMGVSTAGFFLGYGLVLLFCARGMWQGQTWGRSIVVMGQLIQLGVAWSYRSATPDLAGALGVSALLVLLGIFVPSSLRWFEARAEAEAQDY